MSVWCVCPSARPKAEAEACLKQWLDFGAYVMILRDGEPLDLACIQLPMKSYAGFPIASNSLIRAAKAMDPGANWFCLGGDDYYPDLTVGGAALIEHQCIAHFGGTMGVMQPTGDRYGDGYIDKAAASPWIGREFTDTAYYGNGPLFSGYYHLYNDDELQEVAIQMDCFWQRQDIKQEHKHWTRYGIVKPAYADTIYNVRGQQDKETFEMRKAAGFPGARP